MRETSPRYIALAVGVAAIVAVVLGVAWGFFPLWAFWFAIASGFAIAEGTVRVMGAKRGSTYQTIGMLGVLGCAVVCRIVLAQRFGYDWAKVGQAFASSRLDSSLAGSNLTRALALDIPNLVYIGLAMAIPYIRFR